MVSCKYLLSACYNLAKMLSVTIMLNNAEVIPSFTELGTYYSASTNIC